MTSTESYTAVATKAREATEKSVESWKQGAKTFTDQANVVAKMPAVDLTQPVARYFDFVQKSVDLNRDLATRWAELVTSMSGTVREQAEKVSTIVKDQTDRAADVATESAHKAEELAQEQADLAEKAEKEQERLARQAERAAAREAKAKAREPYEELTKAELSDQLAERGLPKSGNVEELIERLVSADSE
jgi:uncharacterized phage infection (PIP) family protein YhgE